MKVGNEVAQERVQKTKATSKEEVKQAEVDAVVDEEAAKLKAETDDLLDEIDGLLEENAEEFVKSYVLEGRRVDSARPLRRSLVLV